MTARGRITVCASTSYPDLLADACRQLLLAGWIVYPPVPFGRQPNDVEARLLAADHEAKIRDSDAVCLVRKPDGSFGESVTREGDYARSLGLAVLYADEVKESV